MLDFLGIKYKSILTMIYLSFFLYTHNKSRGKVPVLLHFLIPTLSTVAKENNVTNLATVKVNVLTNHWYHFGWRHRPFNLRGVKNPAKIQIVRMS